MANNTATMGSTPTNMETAPMSPALVNELIAQVQGNLYEAVHGRKQPSESVANRVGGITLSEIIRQRTLEPTQVQAIPEATAKLPETTSSGFPAQDLNKILAQITALETPEIKKPKQKNHTFRAVLAAGMLVGLLGGLVGANKLVGSDDKPKAKTTGTVPFRDQPRITIPQPTAPSTTEAPTTTAAPTTTEAPKPVAFEVAPQNGYIGNIYIPAICVDAEVYTHSEEENKWELTGNAVIDRMKVDPAPLKDCPERDAREAEFEAKHKVNYVTRDEQRAAAIEGGKVDQWKPTVGHARSADGGYTSVMPGQEGNFVFDGHRTKYSAPLTDIGLLKPGDNIYFHRGDGRKYTHVVLEEPQNLPANTIEDYERILKYSNIFYSKTGTLMACGDSRGLPGGKDVRVTVRTGQVSVQ